MPPPTSGTRAPKDMPTRQRRGHATQDVGMGGTVDHQVGRVISTRCRLLANHGPAESRTVPPRC